MRAMSEGVTLVSDVEVIVPRRVFKVTSAARAVPNPFLSNI
ncbi:hypothetical protein [Hyphomicrobium sp. NDB2Meth4]|nr:hypothetical protein [Hyphomicrobium sp. NDB2Meth4]